jgi:flagellar hook-length control protein FliK
VQQLNVPQVAFEVARQFGAGNTRFQIRLDPADLGRIDVKLDLDKSGTVNAHMVVERPETLDLMMRDQRALQQALQQAGLDQSKTSLEFSLRQSPFGGTGADTGHGGGNGQPGFGPYGTPMGDESVELAAQTLYRGSASASGVNLFV